jgi:nicotinamide-nucleotide amidase
MSKSAAQILINNNLTLSIAESCTGGLISSMMTDVSGSSAYIKINFVTYANEAKTKYLEVKKETLDKYGAVSEQTASEMLDGILKNSDCDIALCTTGIAGPKGGSAYKPVGLLYVGVANSFRKEIFMYEVNPKFPRKLIKYFFAKFAINRLNDFLRENYNV